jgi:hypothetical protein
MNLTFPKKKGGVQYGKFLHLKPHTLLILQAINDGLQC